MHQIHKDNHYVPKLYLKQWANDGLVSTYSLLVPHSNVSLWKNHSPKALAFHQHLYTSTVNGEESDELERWLDREFEAPAEKSIVLAVTDRQLGSEDWRKLVRFALAQDVRTPARLRDFLRRQASTLPGLLEGVVETAVERLRNGTIPPISGVEGSDLPLKVVIESLENESAATLKAEIVVGRSLWHWSIRHLLTDTASKISMKGWTILKPARGSTWPTSDNPLIRLSYVNDYNYSFSGGWELVNGDVFLPLSPEHLLYRCGGVRSLQRGHRLDLSTTEKIRRIIIEHADRYVFSQTPFDVESVRKRVVDAKTVKAERQVWENWNAEQTHAEQGYARR